VAAGHGLVTRQICPFVICSVKGTLLLIKAAVPVNKPGWWERSEAVAHTTDQPKT
jgi:hypothetical protein